MIHPNIYGDKLLLKPTSFFDDMKDNTTGSSTLEVKTQIWKLNQDALRVRNVYKMGS